MVLTAFAGTEVMGRIEQHLLTSRVTVQACVNGCTSRSWCWPAAGL